MLMTMTKLTQRRRKAGWAAAVLVTLAAAAVHADDAPTTPTKKPVQTRTTKHVVSTEAGGTVPTEGTASSDPAPTNPPARSEAPGELPPLPTTPNATAPSDSRAPRGDAQSSEPPAPSEYDYAADTDPAALRDFQDVLAPYGTWTEHATYGVVWTPNAAVVGANFAPYVTHGHWSLGVDNAWLWVSDFSWGWAPFHYGRWIWIGGMGWGWIPGRVYAPAWVVWRTGFYNDHYVGWAPMPPTWYWRGGWAYRLGFYPPAPYVFCPASYVFAPHVHMHIAPPAQVGLIAPRTRPYVAANVASTGGAPTAYALTRGPSPVEAKIPASAVPVERAAPDPRAVSYARTQTPSRSFAAPAAPRLGAFGRTDMGPRPFGSTPGAGVTTARPLPPTSTTMPAPRLYTPGPLPPLGASVPSPRMYEPRPVYPTIPTQPVMPMGPRPGSMVPSIPRYDPPSMPSFSRPSPAVGPGSPAPVFRPSAPPAMNFSRPSMPAPPTVAPAVRSAPVVPRISR